MILKSGMQGSIIFLGALMCSTQEKKPWRIYWLPNHCNRRTCSGYRGEMHIAQRNVWIRSSRSYRPFQWVSAIESSKWLMEVSSWLFNFLCIRLAHRLTKPVSFRLLLICVLASKPFWWFYGFLIFILNISYFNFSYLSIFLILDLGFDVLNSVCWLNIKGDGLTRLTS